MALRNQRHRLWRGRSGGIFYLLQLPLTGSYAMGSGSHAMVLKQGQAHLIHNAMPLHMEFSADLTLLVLKFDRRHFAAFAADAVPRHPAENQRSGYIVPLDRGPGASLRRAVEFATVETLARCPFGNRPESRPHAEALLVETIIGSFQASFARNGGGHWSRCPPMSVGRRISSPRISRAMSRWTTS
jgi:hypothetical protein